MQSEKQIRMERGTIMADFEIIYPQAACRMNRDEYKQAKCAHCPYLDDNVDEYDGIACTKEYWRYILKGMTLKDYELEKIKDYENIPFPKTMELRTSNKTYSCLKVIKDGVVIFNEYDNDDQTPDE